MSEDRLGNEAEAIFVVIHPFGNYAKGDIITDPAAIAAVHNTGQSSRVVATVPPKSSANIEKGH